MTISTYFIGWIITHIVLMFSNANGKEKLTIPFLWPLVALLILIYITPIIFFVIGTFFWEVLKTWKEKLL